MDREKLIEERASKLAQSKGLMNIPAQIKREATADVDWFLSALRQSVPEGLQQRIRVLIDDATCDECQNGKLADDILSELALAYTDNAREELNRELSSLDRIHQAALKDINNDQSLTSESVFVREEYERNKFIATILSRLSLQQAQAVSKERERIVIMIQKAIPYPDGVKLINDILASPASQPEEKPETVNRSPDELRMYDSDFGRITGTQRPGGSW
jgi:hypothetical protein